MHVREALHLLASFHFLASFLFLLRDIAHMIHIRYIAHMVQNLVKQVEWSFVNQLYVQHAFLLLTSQAHKVVVSRGGGQLSSLNLNLMPFFHNN